MNVKGIWDHWIVNRRRRAEVGGREKTEVGGRRARARARDRDPHPRGIRSAVTSEFHRAGITQINAERKRIIGHRRTQTHTDAHGQDNKILNFEF